MRVFALSQKIDSDRLRKPRESDIAIMGAFGSDNTLDHPPETATTRLRRMPPNTQNHNTVIDIGVNLTEEVFKHNWRDVIQRAVDSGVERIVLIGLTVEESLQSLVMAEQWFEETGCPNLYVTVGVHPYSASTWNTSSNGHGAGGEEQDEEKGSLHNMRELLKHPLAVAVGECGLDYSRAGLSCCSSKEHQKKAFREQVQLACEVGMPLFLHEREAHEDFLAILDEVSIAHELPPIVVHCFTGTLEEATEYVIHRGFSISVAGIICSKSRGKHLRKLLPALPVEKLMVETDAPFLNFYKNKKNGEETSRQHSEPEDSIDVVRKLGETLDVPFDEICDITTRNAMEFFRIAKW